MSYSPWGHKQPDMTERLTHTHIHTHTHTHTHKAYHRPGTVLSTSHITNHLILTTP